MNPAVRSIYTLNSKSPFKNCPSAYYDWDYPKDYDAKIAINKNEMLQQNQLMQMSTYVMMSQGMPMPGMMRGRGVPRGPYRGGPMPRGGPMGMAPMTHPAHLSFFGVSEDRVKEMISNPAGK